MTDGKNLHSEESVLDESSTVANVNQAIDKYPRDNQYIMVTPSATQNKKYNPYFQQHPSNSLVNLNTNQPRIPKLSRSEKSGL